MKDMKRRRRREGEEGQLTIGYDGWSEDLERRVE
jgi:hypothetical protein